jgi:1-acyl-sn-glycerol-3-phosphate acyltransferase
MMSRASIVKEAILRGVQIAIFALVVRPFTHIFLGLNVKNRHHLPKKGPAIIIANHNSHMDTIALMAQMPLARLWNVRPIAAADHFAKGIVGFLARTMLRSILISRERGVGEGALDPVLSALDRNEIIIFFPEGSRGESEIMSPFKRGISLLVRRRPDVPVIPVYLHNMGRCMPKGSLLFVPFNCEMIVAEAADLSGVPTASVSMHLQEIVTRLSKETSLATWDYEQGHGLGDAPGAGVADHPSEPVITRMHDGRSGARPEGGSA